MKFLKSYTGGLVVLAVVIVLSVLLGSHRSLVGERAKVEAQFAPIAGDLQDCLDITANLLTVAGSYLEGGDLRPLADARTALALLSAAFYGRSADRLTIVGITGTKGKTTTAYILRSILTAAGCKTGMIGTVGTFIGDKMVCDARNTTPESLELHQRFAQME